MDAAPAPGAPAPAAPEAPAEPAPAPAPAPAAPAHAVEAERRARRDRRALGMMRELVDLTAMNDDEQVQAQVQALPQQETGQLPVPAAAATSGTDYLKPPRSWPGGDACIICADEIPPGHNRLKQSSCVSIMCQECALHAVNVRLQDSGKPETGCNNGEFICTACSSSHPLKPSVLARVVPQNTFRQLQVSFVQ